MVWQALLTCNLVALMAMVGATQLMIDTIRPDPTVSVSPLDRQLQSQSTFRNSID